MRVSKSLMVTPANSGVWHDPGHDRKNRARPPPMSGPPISLFEHALRLHREAPDSPLFRDGEPLPDDGQHRRRPRPRAPEDHRSQGIEAAAILDAHFADAAAQPSDLADVFHEVYVPIQPNEHITAAACRVDARRVRETGRWLVRRATDRCAVTIGLTLLTTVWDAEDVPLIQTLGLISHHFAPLAVRALERRTGGTDALLWLARRVDGWGRVYTVESLCSRGGVAERAWLLRGSCDGNHLNGYFAGRVATAAHLHEAITSPEPDLELVDHTGVLLEVMTECGGMGTSLAHYPPARLVLDAHSTHADRLEPTAIRYSVIARLADYLHQRAADEISWDPGQREQILARYLSLLARDDWSDPVRTAHAAGDPHFTWLAETIAPRLALRAFTPQ
jgi:hypothetical protein